MALTERLALLVTLDAKGAIKGLKDIEKTADRSLSKTEQKIDRLGVGMQKAGAGMVAAGGLLAVGLFKAAKASEEAKLSVVKLENSLKNNPRLAGESSKAFIDLADAIQDKTAADGDAIVAGQAMLATFPVTGDQIRKLTPLVVDYARKFGVDLVTANASVGKALDGSVGALKRNGISIDETLFKTDRYAAVQKALAEQVGGFAEAEGKTFAGSLERLKNQLGDLVEGVGGGAVDAFSSLLGPVEKVSEKFNELDPDTQSLIGKFATFGAVGLTAAGGLSYLVGKAIQLRTNLKGMPAQIGDLVGGLSGLKAKAAVAAAGIGLLALVAYKTQQRAADLKQAIEDLRHEAEQTGDSLVVVAERQLVKTITESEDAREALVNLGLSYGDLREPLRMSEGDFNSWRDNLLKTADAQGIMRQNVSEIVAPLATYRNTTREASEETAAAAAAVEELGLVADGTGGSADALTGATDGLGGSMDDAGDDATELADKIKEVDDAYGNLLDATLSQFDADLAYKGALDNTEDALDDVNTALKEHGGKSEEYRRSVLDAQGALLDQADAAADLMIATLEASGETVGAAQKQDIYVDALKGVRDTLAPGSPLRAALDGYITTLDNVPRTLRTTLLANASGAFQTVQEFLNYLKVTGFDGPPTGATSLLKFKQDRMLRAEGGPIYRADGGPSGTDTVPAWLTPGEFVMRKSAVDKIGLPALYEMNKTGSTDSIVERAVASQEPVDSPDVSVLSRLMKKLGSIKDTFGADSGMADPVYRAKGGPSGSDTVPAWLTPGEFVMQKSAVDTIGLPNMYAMNSTGQTSGNTYSITVNALDPKAAGKVVVDAIQSFESSNGKGWRAS